MVIFNTSLLTSKAEYHSGYYIIFGYNIRYSAQMRRKKTMLFPLHYENRQEYTVH